MMHLLIYRGLIFLKSCYLYFLKVSPVTEFYPQPPQGGLLTFEDFKKSPLGSRDFGIGVILSRKIL
jgi:hypothetical protein